MLRAFDVPRTRLFALFSYLIQSSLQHFYTLDTEANTGGCPLEEPTKSQYCLENGWQWWTPPPHQPQEMKHNWLANAWPTPLDLIVVFTFSQG